MRHPFGCTCAQCTGRAAQAYTEARHVRDHNRRIYLPPHVRNADPFAMHYRFDWQGQPKAGEAEYLAGL